MVYKDDLISTIVDSEAPSSEALVYKDDLISTIVDFYFRRSFFVSHSRQVRDKFGKTVIKDLMAETMVIGFFPAALDK